MTDEAAKQQRERACDSKMGHAVTGVVRRFWPPSFPPESCHVRNGKHDSQSSFCSPQLTLHTGSKATVLFGSLTIGVRLRARGAQLALHLAACPVNLTANLNTALRAYFFFFFGGGCSYT
jgi:hypothetical protein